MLERLDGGPGGVTEVPVRLDRHATENGGQPALDVCDRLSLVAEGERKAYRYAAISWRS
jgi:hypothetical protein